MSSSTEPSPRRVFASPATGETRATAAGLSHAQTIDAFLDAVDGGTARDRSGGAFTRGIARDLHWYLGGHTRAELGTLRSADVRRADVEQLVFELASDVALPAVMA